MRSVSKALRFPLGGIAKNLSYRDTTYPSEESVYSTPMAFNVIGECAFSERMRGGSRPGLKAFTGDQPWQTTTDNWMWPNGEKLLWPKRFTQWECETYEFIVVTESTYDAEEHKWTITFIDDTTQSFTASVSDASFDGKELALTIPNAYLEEALTFNRSIEGGEEMIFAVNEPAVTPDGGMVIDQHARISVATTKGALPDDLDCIAVYRDRVIVSKDNLFFASRTNDHGDFDFGGEGEDVTRAVAGQIAKAGDKGEKITAIMPIGDNALFIATARRVALFSDEVTSGMTTISDFVGVISRDAWCNANGVLYFMGDRGLYVTGQESVIAASPQMPEDLKGLASALLVYDPERKGIHIFTTRGTGASAVNADYFYDIDNKAFWPMMYNAQKRPVMGGSAIIGGVHQVIFKCADDVWRYWDDATTTDGGAAFSSMVAIGPFKCGTNDDVDGMLAAITATLGNGSSTVTISGYMGKSAEAAYNAAASAAQADFTINATSGWNCKTYPRCRGAWCVLKLTASSKWAYESIKADIKVLGGLRNG